MAIDYVEMSETASKLLDENGKTSAFIRRTGISNIDPVLGTVTQEPPVDIPMYTVQISQSEAYTPGALIGDGELFWIVDTPVEIADELLVNGMLYNVIRIWEVVPGDIYIDTRVQTRGGVKVAV